MWKNTLILFLFPLALSAQSDVSSLASILEYTAEADDYNGNILVAQNGKVVYRGSFGVSRINEDIPLDSATVFRLASVSKQFTALGIALLENDGKLAYDDLLGKHIPELAFYEGVTIRHLLHHYGGLPDYMGMVIKAKDFDRVHNNKSIIEVMAARKPKVEFAAGTKSNYSNTGYLLLASVIEKLSGKTYSEFLAERVFEPFGMTRTSVPYPSNQLDENTAGSYAKNEKTGAYFQVDIGQDPFGYYVLADVVGDGMVHSTVDDLFRYSQGLLTDKILPADKRTVLTTPGNLEKGKGKYAFGQQITTSEEGMVVNHSGSWAGYLTYLERHPDKGNVIVALSNFDSPYSRMVRPAQRFLAGEKITKPKVFTSIEIDAAILKDYTGTYELTVTKTTTFKFKASKGKLVMEVPNQPKYELTPFQKDGFYLDGLDVDLTFTRDASGKVTGFDYYQRGVEGKGVKK
jgi:CubicO group peptidase (beta-lactamase class C family)